MRYCPQCGQRVEEDDAFCFECGTQLESGQIPHGVEAKPTSMGTVWAAGILALIAIIESLGYLLYAEEALEMAGFGEEISAELIMLSAGFGLLLGLLVIGLTAYYYNEGYVEKQFFWGLIGIGLIGFLFGSALSFLFIVIVGVYGMLAVVR